MSVTAKATVSPSLLIWARERAGFSNVHALADRFPLLPSWEKGESSPTLKQLEDFAKTVHIAIGYLFLPNPPREELPIADFRICASSRRVPSVHLLDTIYLCQQRQDWYCSYVLKNESSPCRFVQSATLQTSAVEVAKDMRTVLGFELATQKSLQTYESALRYLCSCVEGAGVLVMSSSIVGSNTARKLDVQEFRGFSLSDEYAPVIFINTSDAKSARMFTVVHELAHIWLGKSVLSDALIGGQGLPAVERWCNKVAAEFLLPLDQMSTVYKDTMNLDENARVIAKTYKVSKLVAIIRLQEAGLISREKAQNFYDSECKKQALSGKKQGGDFSRSLTSRTGKLFLKAVLSSTFEGETLFQDACRLLSVKKISLLSSLAKKLGVL